MDFVSSTVLGQAGSCREAQGILTPSKVYSLVVHLEFPKCAWTIHCTAPFSLHS